MDWLLEKFPVWIIAFVIGARILQAIAKSRSAQQRHEQNADETEEQRRVREIQERIRRAIAARRGGQPVGGDQPPVLASAPAASEDSDPFHDEDEPPAVPTPDPHAAARALRNAELERQAQLAERMRALAEARELARHKAEQAAAELKMGTTGAAMRRHHLDDMIRDREDLRRAVLLREILGPPVGLR